MPMERNNDMLACLVVEEVMRIRLLSLLVVSSLLLKRWSRKRPRGDDRRPYSLVGRLPEQVRHLNRLVNVNDNDCISNLRMDRNTFGKLCMILKHTGGLSDVKYVCVEQQVAMFLGVLAHHKKNRVTGFDFIHSGETVHHYLHLVLRTILHLHHVFMIEPMPIANDCEDPRWKHFKGCLGALDGTHFQVTVPAADKPRFRNRKGQICINTLACCDPQLRFTYMLPGWEGSAADGRVLRDAVNRPNGLKVPRGTYYLCDGGYANGEGFLTPYKMVRYHLKEWGPECVQPTSPVELFNMRHTKARNVIERAFGILKMRWGILRSPSYYPVKVQIRLIMCCFLLHNFIRSEMNVDPMETMLDELQDDIVEDNANNNMAEDDFINTVEGSPEWNQFRDQLGIAMWEEYH